MVERFQPFSFRVTGDARKAYERAAEAAGLSVSEWVRLVLDAASGASELPEQLTRVIKYQPKPVRDGKW